VPNVKELKDKILREAHESAYSIHPGGNKMYHDLKAELYMSRIVCLRGVLKKIASDRGTQFTSKFGERLNEALDTQLHFSSAYHPQTDGQIKRVNQILEDMLRA
jgi:transposase InsO family protein